MSARAWRRIHLSWQSPRISVTVAVTRLPAQPQRPLNPTGRALAAESVGRQRVPQVSIADMTRVDRQRCRDVSVCPDQIEPSGLQPAFLVGGEAMRAFGPGG